MFKWYLFSSRVALVGKNPPANAGDTGEKGSVPGLGRFPGEGHGNSLQYSCLENSMDQRTWLAIVWERVRHNWSDLAGTHETDDFPPYTHKVAAVLPVHSFWFKARKKTTTWGKGEKPISLLKCSSGKPTQWCLFIGQNWTLWPTIPAKESGKNILWFLWLY